jgi:pyrrolidone-carboxylate peptidase
LGQHPRGNKIRIERKAVNLKKTSRKDKPQIIYKNRPKYQFLNLKLKKDKDSWISYDASTYVCNFSMYLISYYGHKKNIKFAFIHIPYNYKLKKAVKFVNHKINEITDF